MPGRQRVGEMVQHAAGLDDVEGAPDRFQLQDVGLRVRDIVHAERA
jgi:hypothetical protein